MGKKEFKFDKALKRLEELVERLSIGELELDEALNLFEEGIKLSVECFKKLEESKAKVEFLIKQSEEAFKRIEASAETFAEKGVQLSNELGLDEDEVNSSKDLFADDGSSEEEEEEGSKPTKTPKSKNPNLFDK